MGNRIVFGIEDFTPYRRSDQLPYGRMEILGGANLEFNSETEKLFGGSSKYPYASNPTQINASMTVNVKAFDDFMFQLFVGAQVSTKVAAANGEVDNIENVKGASLINAATGIDTFSVLSGSEANLKFGKYLAIATSSTEVDIYLFTGIDSGRGVAVSFLDGYTKVATGLTVVASTDTNITNLGIKIEGGSGTIGLTTGDSATFEVFPTHDGISEIVVGGSSDVFPRFGATCVGAKDGDGNIFGLELYNCQGAGMPLPMQEKQYMIADLTVDVLYDQDKNAVYRAVALKGVI